MSEKKQPLKVLVVDDDPGILRLLERTLAAAHGYDVLTAGESRVGLQLAREKKPDLIILDILIPDMSGGELAKSLSRIPETKDIPIVFISVILEAGGRKRIDVAGTQYRAVAKPLHQPALLAAIRKTLNEAKHRKQGE